MRLYLQPGLPRGLPIFDRGGFACTRSWGATMAEEGLGGDVRWFVYENVDPTRLGAEVIAALNADPNLARLTVNGQPLTAAQRLEAFLEGQVQVTIAEGAEVGRASTGERQHRATCGACSACTPPPGTSIRWPSTWPSPRSSPRRPRPTCRASPSLVGTDWPGLPGTSVVDVLAATRTQLYPYPVLSWARRKVDGVADLWHSVRDGQKALYWEQLRVRGGHSTTGHPFTYNTDEMGNPFQLEAVSELFLDWVVPAVAGTSPGATVPVPPKVDLLEPGWTIVIVDPFDHPNLGTPALPRPDYTLAPYTPPQPVVPCEPSVTLPLQADRYRGALFLVRDGPGGGLAPLVDHLQPPLGGLPAPVGPQRVGAAATTPRPCRATGSTSSGRAPPTVAAINYAIQLWDPEALSNYVNYDWSPGRYYFRAGSPMDDGSFASDGEAGKKAVMLHYGYANDQHNQQFDYIGSAGCIVSPEYYKLRGRMVALQLASSSEENLDLEVLLGADKARSEGLHQGHILVYRRPYAGWASWDNQLQGTAYVIRPDEPEQR